MGNLRTARLTNKDADFYPLLGPFLANRAVVKAVGCPPWDDDGKVWFVALDGKQVAGFAAVVLEGESVAFCSDFVWPAGDRAEAAVRAALMKERLEYVAGKAKAASAVVSAADRPAYLKAGFKTVRETVNYTKVAKELS